MKRFFAIASLALAVASCAAPSQKETVHTGDLLFVGIPSDGEFDGMENAIASATGEGQLNMIHSAIIERDDTGAVWVIDATIRRGVDRHPIDTLIKDFTRSDGSIPALEVYRLKDESNVNDFIARAKFYIGEKYDEYFLPDNGRHYCTELVYDSYICNGVHLFQNQPMNFKNTDGSFDEYWIKLFNRLRIDIPQDVPGTNPQAMSSDTTLFHVGALIDLL